MRSSGTHLGVTSHIGLALSALALGTLATPGTALAQRELSRAVDVARTAWIKHDVQGLVSGSDTVRLHLPGVATSASVRPGQAARLLDRYLKQAGERSFDLRELLQLADDHAYAEMVRLFVVEGTEEERRETVFLGFRFLDGRWRLREVRVTP